MLRSTDPNQPTIEAEAEKYTHQLRTLYSEVWWKTTLPVETHSFIVMFVSYGLF